MACVLLALAIVVRWPSLIAWAVAIAGGSYLIGRVGVPGVDSWAAVIGVALLLAAELASWSIAHDARIRSEPSFVLRRCATLAMLVAAALLVNFLLLGTAAVSAGAGLLLAAAGVAAAVSSMAVVHRLLQRH
jgi:hypothetical protein